MTEPPAPQDLLIEPLTPKQVRAVYPLMRAAYPSLSLSRWLRYARAIASDRGLPRECILVARRAALPHPSGAVCYWQERSMSFGQVSAAEHFIALDLLYPDAVLSALVSELESVAGAIRSIVDDRRSTLLESLRRAGHRTEGVTFTKIVSCIGGADQPAAGPAPGHLR